MAAWVVFLGDSLTEGVELATAHEAALAFPLFLPDLTSERMARAPEQFVALVTHLLQGTSGPFYDCYELAQVIRRFRVQLPEKDLTPIIEESIQLGCSDATSW